jgi:hypothetical protein
MKLFGREPAVITATGGAFLTFLAAVGVPGVSAGAAAAITSLVAAGVIAATTRPVAPALLTGVVSAGVAVLSEYGMHVADDVTGAATGLVLALFGLLTRGQVSPAQGVGPGVPG